MELKYKISVAVVGSRNFTDEELAFKILGDMLHKIGKIVSGGAKGADSIGRKFAEKHGIEIQEFIPDWSKGRSAGIERNADIVEAAGLVIAFWDGVSPGTKNTIERTIRAKKPLMIVCPEEEIKDRFILNWLKKNKSSSITRLTQSELSFSNKTNDK